MKIYYRLSIFIFYVFISLTVISSEVSRLTARQVAINALQERNKVSSKKILISEVIPLKADDIVYAYVLNFKNNEKGFIIISAEDACLPVLGYSLSNNFIVEELPPQLNALLDEYKQQILFLKKNKFNSLPKIQAEWNRLNTKPENFAADNFVDQIPPMLLSTWDQGFPYNEMCPGGALVGCVAIAMGQVMKYWSHPIFGENSHGYTHYNYGYQFADFGNTTYHFENMPPDETNSNIDLATLLYHCGVAVEMNYSTSSSGSTLDGYYGAANAMKNFFRFDAELYHDKKYKYSDSVWRQMILTDLENGFPIIYGGWDGWEGHAWNLDGYEKVGDLYHYHMNWGWGGTYNGYFYLDDLTPGYTNWTSGQEAIFNLKPYAVRTITCYPQSQNYATGTTNANQKTQTSLINSIYPEQGWITFDISGIPDGATIYATEFNGFVYERYRPDWAITPVTVDPLSADATALHADIIAEQDVGNYYMRDESNVSYPAGWFRKILAGTCDADLESALATNQFSLGFAAKYPSTTHFIKFHGWNETNPPTLKVYFTAYGTLEGHVYSYGTSIPISDSWVSISHFKDTTDANGYFHFDNVPIGSYDLLVESNNNSNPAGNPYLNQTIEDVIIDDGIAKTQDVFLPWAEISASPSPLTISVDPYQQVQSQLTLTNEGPGKLEYTAHVSPPLGDMLINWDAESATGDPVIYGCSSDGTCIWITGKFETYGEHKLYKLDLEGNLIATYTQGTSSQWGMRRMTFDGQFLYSADLFGFYKIDPADGSIQTMFTDFPEGLYTITSLAWIPSLGFVASYEDEDLFVFNSDGNLLQRLPSPAENFHSNDMTFDAENNCLWLAKNNTNYYYQYDLETFQLTGLFYEVPTFPNCTYQSTAAVFYTEDLFPGKTVLCGLTYGNPVSNFFAHELESWLKITANKTGTISGYAKANQTVDLEINSGTLAMSSKTADIVVASNAGQNLILPVTIVNNYSHGGIAGTITEYGTGNPIANATITINGQSGTSNPSGNYTITGIPIGIYELTVTSDNYLADTAWGIPITGITETCNRELKWTEINLTPSPFSITLPANTLDDASFSITNSGPGDFHYNCQIVETTQSKSSTILVVDRDMSNYFAYEEEYMDEWWSYEEALDDNNLNYTYFEVPFPWMDGPDLSTMQQYDLIIWFTGHTDSYYGMTFMDEQNLADYLDGGGNLYLASKGLFNNYGWPIAIFNPGDFAYDYLGLRNMEQEFWYIWLGDEGIIEGATGSFADGNTYDFENFYWDDIGVPKITNYVGNDLMNINDPSPLGLCATTYAAGNFKTIFTSLSFGLLSNPIEKANLIGAVINYFTGAWLTITTNGSGVVNGISKEMVNVGLQFNSTGLAEDTYEAEIYIYSNAPSSPEILPVSLTVGDYPGIDLKIWLEGAYTSNAMRTDINSKNLLPLNQPFNMAPWNYFGNESVSIIPNSQVVDWLLVEFRDALDASSATPATRVGQKAAFLLENGSIVGLDGISYLQLSTSINNQLYIVLSHRNHLDVMNANPLTTVADLLSYDFTSDASKFYGGANGCSELSNNVWGMSSGNGTADIIINDADKVMTWENQAGLTGYLQGDFNNDCQVNNTDKNDYWKPNTGKGSQVPQ